MIRSILTTLAVTTLPFGAFAHETMNVVASFSILGDMVEEVGGDLVTVTTIVGPNADAHVYTPSVEDALAVTNAEAIFVNGLGFETWSATLIESSGTEAPIFVATEGVNVLEVDGEIDPHAWNSLSNGQVYVANIAAALSEMDPSHAGYYQANAEAYSAKLTELAERAGAALAQIPADSRTVVTAHDAFGYLAREFDMNFLAPVGIDTDAEPSAREMADLISQLRETDAAALFVENITSPALVEQISRETGLGIGGRLYSDALSVKGGPATSYLAMYDHNLTTLIKALQPQM